MHADVCAVIADLVENAIGAGARGIVLTVATAGRRLDVCVADDGPGMTPERLASLKNPFASEGVKHPGRPVALGIPFLAQMAEATGGACDIVSEPGTGTSVRFEVDLGHVDAPAFGDLAGTLALLMNFDGEYELSLLRRHGARRYAVSRGELIEALGGGAGGWNDAQGLALMRDYLRGLEEDATAA